MTWHFCVAGVALGDMDLCFAWQVWYLATWTCVLRGRCGTWRHAPSFCVLALGDIHLRLRARPCAFGTRNFVTHTHAHTHTHTRTLTSLSHTTLSHTIFHTQLHIHTHLFVTHNFVTHHLPHTHTFLSHTIFHTHFCHTLAQNSISNC